MNLSACFRFILPAIGCLNTSAFICSAVIVERSWSNCNLTVFHRDMAWSRVALLSGLPINRGARNLMGKIIANLSIRYLKNDAGPADGIGSPPVVFFLRYSIVDCSERMR